MSCPCHRAIDSATPQIPDAAITIIADYRHSFSDQEFDKINKYNESYIAGDDDGTVEYDILGMNTREVNSDSWASVMIRYCTNVMIFEILDIPEHDFEQEYCCIKCNENMFDFICTNFGQENMHDLWNNLHPGAPMKPRFIATCDAVIRVITDWLYSEPRALVCV